MSNLNPPSTASLGNPPGCYLLLDDTLPPGAIGVAYNGIILASRGTSPYIYSLDSGSLPTGLTMSSYGILSGIPSSTGTFDFQVTAVDFYGKDGSRWYEIGIVPPDCSFSPTSSVPSPQCLQYAFDTGDPNPIALRIYSFVINVSGVVPPDDISNGTWLAIQTNNPDVWETTFNGYTYTITRLYSRFHGNITGPNGVVFDSDLPGYIGADYPCETDITQISVGDVTFSISSRCNEPFLGYRPYTATFEYNVTASNNITHEVTFYSGSVTESLSSCTSDDCHEQYGYFSEWEEIPILSGNNSLVWNRINPPGLDHIDIGVFGGGSRLTGVPFQPPGTYSTPMHDITSGDYTITGTYSVITIV